MCRTSGRDCMDGMVLELDGTVSTLRDVSAPAKLVELLVKSTLKFLASRVVNSVLQGQGLVNTQTAFKLKMGLSKLHEWLSLPHVALLVQGLVVVFPFPSTYRLPCHPFSWCASTKPFCVLFFFCFASQVHQFAIY